MRLTTSFFIAFFAFSFLAQAQEQVFFDETQLPRFQSTLVIPPGAHPSPSGVHFRGDFSTALADSFQLALETMRDNLDSKGLSAAILADNGDEWRGATGVSFTGTDMTTDMYLGMGNVSKSITAACILKLEEEGALSIEDSLGTYLGAFPYVQGSITIHQLLNHTSGIFDYIENPSILDSMKEDFSRIWQPEEILNTFVEAPYFSPGTGWHYSNSNYLLLGLIIENITNQNYHEVIRQKLFVPHGLDSLFLNPYETTTGNIAHVWLNYPGVGKVDLDILGLTPKSVYSAGWAAGGFFSKPILATRWMSTLLHGEVLSDVSMAKMLTFVPANQMEYGLGLMKIGDNNQFFIGHQGYIIYSSLSFYDPLTKLTISVQSNDGSSTDLSAFLIKAYELYLNSLVGTDAPTTTVGQAYPNPALDIITLNLPQGIDNEYDITASDILGRRLAAKIAQQSKTSIKLDISNWGKGLFHIEIQDKNQRVIYSVVR